MVDKLLLLTGVSNIPTSHLVHTQPERPCEICATSGVWGLGSGVWGLESAGVTSHKSQEVTSRLEPAELHLHPPPEFI